MQCFGKFYPGDCVLVMQHQRSSEFGSHFSTLAHVTFNIDGFFYT